MFTSNTTSIKTSLEKVLTTLRLQYLLLDKTSIFALDRYMLLETWTK